MLESKGGCDGFVRDQYTKDGRLQKGWGLACRTGNNKQTPTCMNRERWNPSPATTCIRARDTRPSMRQGLEYEEMTECTRVWYDMCTYFLARETKSSGELAGVNGSPHLLPLEI